MRAFNHLKDGYKVRVGAGEVSFWYDRMLSDGFLCEKLPYVNTQDTTLLIKDVCVNGAWNFDLLAIVLPSKLKNKCSLVHVNPSIQDLLIWAANVHDSYSSCSTVSWLQDLWQSRHYTPQIAWV